MNVSKVVTHSVAPMWAVPLGQTPNYLDPQSQEALHEVDLTTMELFFSFDQAPDGNAIGSVGGNYWVGSVGDRTRSQP
ncbi:MAG: hypothetical protein ACREJN_19510 [Nitrospiraceae bacterium]